jgi:hypothetical protein
MAKKKIKIPERRKRFCREYLITEKLRALRELGKHMGMFGPLRKYRKIKADPAMILFIFVNYLRDDIPPYQRVALAMLLDFYLPKWREIVGDKILGPAVDRNSREVARWRRLVIKRDGKCIECGSKEKLEAHHIVPWLIAPELRTDIQNGEALCQKCHSEKRT